MSQHCVAYGVDILGGERKVRVTEAVTLLAAGMCKPSEFVDRGACGDAVSVAVYQTEALVKVIGGICRA